MNEKRNFGLSGKAILVLSVLACLLVFGASVAGAVFLSISTADDGETGVNEYVIAVDDSITVYLGDAFKLSPHLVCEDGTIEQARFEYESTSDSVAVDKDGNTPRAPRPSRSTSSTNLTKCSASPSATRRATPCS